MDKKEKFKPEITKVELNPEQAVLSCSCYNFGFQPGSSLDWNSVCVKGKVKILVSSCDPSSVSS